MGDNAGRPRLIHASDAVDRSAARLYGRAASDDPWWSGMFEHCWMQ
jgi:hypothetical protein